MLGWFSEASTRASRSNRARRSASRAKTRREHLDRDVAPEARIARAVDLAHAARAEQADDFIGTDASARFELRRGSRICRFPIEVAVSHAQAGSC